MALDSPKADFYSRHRVLVWAGGILVAVFVLASFMSRDEVATIRAITVGRTTIRSVVSTNGKIEPVQSFEAHAPLGTTVQKVLVKEGDHVKKGQLMVQLEDAEARSQAARALAQLRTAQAGISAVQSGGSREEVLTVEAELVKARGAREAAQRNLDALRRLQQTGAASSGEVKDAENQLARADADFKLLQQKQKGRYSQPEIAKAEAQTSEAQAAYAAAQEILNQLNIHAPFDGVVYSLPVRQGVYVNPGDLVLQEADLTKVVVRAFVDEPDVGRLARGQTIELTWDAFPGRTWTGTVDNIPASLKLRGTRNVGEVTCIVDNADLSLLPNVNVGVSIVTAEHKGVLTVPREALRLDDGKNFLYVVESNELQRREVQTSIANLTDVEVTQGLTEHSVVALSTLNGRPLRNHLSVKVIR